MPTYRISLALSIGYGVIPQASRAATVAAEMSITSKDPRQEVASNRKFCGPAKESLARPLRLRGLATLRSSSGITLGDM